MAGILTPASTGDAPPPARTAPPALPPATPPVTTTSMNSPLAGMTAPNATATPPIHSNQAINEALSNAFRPIIPDQINSLLGPAIGQIQGHTNPMAFYQPRPAAQVATRRSSS